MIILVEPHYSRILLLYGVEILAITWEKYHTEAKIALQCDQHVNCRQTTCILLVHLDGAHQQSSLTNVMWFRHTVLGDNKGLPHE